MAKKKTRGLIASYDESDIVEAEVKYWLKEGKKEEPERFAGMDEDAIRNAIYEDGIVLEDAYRSMIDDVTEQMKKLKKAKKFSGNDGWLAKGEGMGWRNLSGYKYFRANDAKDLIQQVFPNTNEWTAHFYRRKGAIYIRVAHHDSPMGEYYTVTPLTNKEYEKNIGELY